MFDLIIRNGKVLDGSGKKPAVKLDIAIQDGKIAEIAPEIPAKKAKEHIDALEKIVAPGFIDIQNHSDSYWTIFDQPDQASLVSQGITTIVMGNCGSSLAPLPNVDSIKTIQKWHNLAGININWTNFEELFAVLEKNKIGVNVATLVGHATLRRGLVGDSVRKVTGDELRVMDRYLKQSLEAGAFGLSMGLVYAHEVNSSTEELLELAKNLKSSKGFLSVHLRSEGSHILESLDEVIELAAKAQVPLKISHLKIQGKKNWHLEGAVLNKMESAFHKGLDISFDTYPYHTSWSVLYTYLPKWVYEGGRETIVVALGLPQAKRKVLDYIKTQEYDFSKITIASAEGNAGFVGKTISEIAKNSGVTNEEALVNILVATKTQAVVFDHNLSDDQVDDFLSSPLSMVATDGAGHSSKFFELVHPRCYGAMPRFLKLVREKKMISWEEAVRKITSEPARLLGLNNRGSIHKDAAADFVIFDPETITDNATYAQPYQFSNGIINVIINGKVAFADSQIQGLQGQVLRKH